MPLLSSPVSWTRLIACDAAGALLGALLGKLVVSGVVRLLEKRNAVLRQELLQRCQYSRSRDPLIEAAVDAACSQHPGLTREEATCAIEEAGF